MSDLKRWQFSLSSLMIFTAAFAVWVSQMTLSVKLLYSQEAPRDAQADLLCPGYLLCWGIGTFLVFFGFRLVARKTIATVLIGLGLIIISVPIFWLPNVNTFFIFLNGV